MYRVFHVGEITMTEDDKCLDNAVKDSLTIVTELANKHWDGTRLIAVVILVGSIIITEAIQEKKFQANLTD